jgi:hypothetical protein
MTLSWVWIWWVWKEVTMREVAWSVIVFVIGCAVFHQRKWKCSKTGLGISSWLARGEREMNGPGNAEETNAEKRDKERDEEMRDAGKGEEMNADKSVAATRSHGNKHSPPL